MLVEVLVEVLLEALLVLLGEQQGELEQEELREEVSVEEVGIKRTCYFNFFTSVLKYDHMPFREKK